MIASKPRPTPRPECFLIHREKRTERQLPLRFDMTIAAGILCSDGIILCADTEHTGEVSKFQASKIIPLDEHTVMTGSGTMDYILMAADKLRDEFNAARPVNPSDARQKVESVVMGVHADHIFNFFQASDPNRPIIDLIVAARCSGGDLALIKTNNSAVRLGTNFEFTGSGFPIFEYWCRYFYRDRLTMAGMATLALFILKEVKKVHPYCGGSSQVFHLPKVEGMPRTTRIFDEDQILLGFPDNIVKILSACFFEDTPTAWIEEKLHEFATGVRAIHQGELFRKVHYLPNVEMRDSAKPSDSGI
jgi:20S proteasome alpha/beta subunit